ncbi:hypothetical protein H2200_013538 [Cladophialophora chaetospira]|uniref:Uncharacterized protein n=1 Tax=Cladophialophora chaetospira TaxID=386627 RepID=A0AA38TYY9_9EURO|nr:hypothetical protein H2200_013538 [Cladophialophora chaetospira]
MASRGRGGQSSLPSHPRGGGVGYGGGRGRGGGGQGGGRGGAVTGPMIFSHGVGDSAQPDQTVKRLEDQLEQSVLKTSKLDAALPVRPAYGTQGRPIILWSNFMQLTSSGTLLLHRYKIEFSKNQVNGQDIKPKDKKRIVQLLLQDNFRGDGPTIATDFRGNLISTKRLSVRPEGYRVTYLAEDEDTPRPNAGRYRIDLLLDSTFTVADLVNYLTSSNASAVITTREEIIQALNIIIGHNTKAPAQIISLGANRHYDWNAAPAERMSLGTGLLAIRGFFLSVRAATARILLNVQVKHAPFYEPGSLDRLMSLFIQSNGPNKVRLSKYIERLSINVTHIVSKNRAGQQIKRMKTIWGLATQEDGRRSLHPSIVRSNGAGPKDVQFWMESSGKYITVFDHFRQTYHVDIADASLPVINVGNREKPSYLPAQVCLIEPGQPFKAELLPSQTQSMIRFAVRKPANNAQSLVNEGVRMIMLNQTPNPTHSTFNINVHPRLVAVSGRVLNSPSVYYHGNKAAATRFGSWNMQNIQFVTKADLPSWTWVMIQTPNDANPWATPQEFEQTLNNFQSELRKVGVNCNAPARGLRVTVQPSVPATATRPRIPGDLDTKIDETFHLFTSTPNKAPPKLVLVVLLSDKAEIYNRVKYVCDIKEGLVSVCVVASKFAKAGPQYSANVALKFNLKLGGRNQVLQPAKLGVISEGKTMVVGLDVTHPSPQSSKEAPSVVGIVASVDKWMSQFPGDIQIQERRKEMVSALTELMKGRLALWRRSNNDSLPDNLLICRDGVSEGQYQTVLQEELPQIRQACREVYPADMTKNGLPRITIVIVGKRHNVRFYPSKDSDADRSFNTPNGTVVDRGVTEARNWDLYLQSHSALQGTARPAHYFVVYDEIFRHHQQLMAKQGKTAPFRSAADALEDLLHSSAYMYGRATKAVSICPPAYYADLVCDRARGYLSGIFDTSTAGSVSDGAGAATPNMLGSVEKNGGDDEST